MSRDIIDEQRIEVFENQSKYREEFARIFFSNKSDFHHFGEMYFASDEYVVNLDIKDKKKSKDEVMFDYDEVI